VRADGTESADFYNEWTAPPAELVEEAIRRWLGASGLFSAVVAPGSRATSELIMETELTALQVNLVRGEARAALSAVLLDGGASGRVLAQFTPSGTVALPAGSREDPTPEESAAAMTRALAAALADLEQALARYA
jgi:ABC-type uncharacterized transport system auxiliary subunit